MASFPASVIASLVNPQHSPFILRDVEGGLMGEITMDHLSSLIEAGIVCGCGSKKRLKWFQMIVDDDEASRVLQQKSAEIGRTRARRPLDVLVRMMADRKFTTKERIEVSRVQGGVVIPSVRFLFQHRVIPQKQ